MFRLILWLLFITLRAEANLLETENPEIRLSNSNSGNENYTVWKDKPLKIILENIYPKYVWCSNKCPSGYNLRSTCVQFVPETEFSNNTINILNITNVTAKMSTRWMCTALQGCHGRDMPCMYYKNRRYIQKYLHFNLHVKGARAVILNANEQKLTYVTTNMSVNYDGEANYSYEDGEDFRFSCEKVKHNHNEDTLRLEYYNAKGILLFQTKPRDQQQHIFRSVLKSNNDKYYLDCIHAAGDPGIEYRYRTTFFKRDFLADASQHAVVLSVNDQNLTTYRNNDNSFDNYIFRYIDGEVLIVTCQKMDVNIRGPLYLYGERMSQTLRSYNPSEAIISLNISTSDIKNKSLSCVINNTNLEKPNAKLFFLSDVPDGDVRIRGLPRNDILYQYTNDKDQWTIEYQYSVNDSLNLTCVWNKGFNAPRWLSPSPKPFQWKFVDDTINSAAIWTPRSLIKFSKTPFTNILDATHNGTKIQCTYFSNGIHDFALSKTVEIILRLKQELVSEAKGDEVTLDTPDDKSMTMIVPIAVGVGVAIAVITMVCLVSWRKRTKRANLIENANDNLSNQNDSPIPAFPSQWEDNYDDPNYAKIYEEVMQENYNYSTDNDKLCRMPDKRQSNTSDNHYTEIDDYVKPKPDGLAANWNTARPSNFKKYTHITTAYPNASYNNLPINNCNKNYSNVPKPSKSVTFRQISNDLRPGRNYSEGNSRQDGRNNETKVKPNNDSHYSNTGQDNIYMQPVDMHKKPDYENNFLQNEKTNNPLDSDYAEPYDDLEITCKNNFYGETRADKKYSENKQHKSLFA